MKPKHAEAHVDLGEEEEGPALFFATVPVNVEAAPASATVHHMDKKVVPQLDDDGERDAGLWYLDAGLWYLDTGATNHMMRAREGFSKLNTSIQGTVRLWDGSVISIQGCGSILFEAKTGEHQCLSGVYYILQLTADIVSLEKLD